MNLQKIQNLFSKELFQKTIFNLSVIFVALLVLILGSWFGYVSYQNEYKYEKQVEKTIQEFLKKQNQSEEDFKTTTTKTFLEDFRNLENLEIFREIQENQEVEEIEIEFSPTKDNASVNIKDAEAIGLKTVIYVQKVEKSFRINEWQIYRIEVFNFQDMSNSSQILDNWFEQIENYFKETLKQT